MNIATTTTRNISTTTKKEKTITIKPPMSDSALWHQLTNWRHADQLYRSYRSIWNKLKRENAIPYYIISRVENENI